MADLFADKAVDWDARPVPQQISDGVSRALRAGIDLQPEWVVMDFGAGTGLIASKIAPHISRIVAVDVSPAMLDQLAQKPELAGKVEIHCQDLLSKPLANRVDLVVSAMAMHHVADTAALLRALFQHLVPGGRVALADLDAEDGTFHPAGTEGVHHAGFARDALERLFVGAGFTEVRFETACDVHRDGKSYPIFIAFARKPAA